MNFRKNAGLFFLFSVTALTLTAQNNYELKNVIPPSATVASLGKYGEIPVSLYTGIPNISIPLYEIKDGPLSLPVSLSYHAGGIKVEEIASNVGLGWSLNAGGVVNRQQRGTPDEQWGWALDPQYRIAYILQNGTETDKIIMNQNMFGGTKDSEADIYSYSAGSLSGKFLFDQAGVIYNYPAKKDSIIPNGTINGGYGWKVIAQDGTIYEFTKAESTQTSTCTGGEWDFKTAWFLTRIRSADTSRNITFTYEDFDYLNYYLLGQTKYYNKPGSAGGCLTNSMLCAGYTHNYTQRITRIDFSGGYVKFTYDNTDRLDLPGDKSLKRVEIYTSANTLVKKYDLAYSYFGSGSIDQYGKRLKLTSVTEKSATEQKPAYEFTYEESIEMPDRVSYSQDHWGFYNGKTNTSLIPSFWHYDAGTSENRLIISDADRTANPETNQACILKKIKYPTGGESIFTYETNTVADSRIPPKTTDVYNNFSLNQSYSSLYSPYETTTFTIPSQGADVEFSVSGITASNAYCNYEINLNCYLIKDNDIDDPYADITDASTGTHMMLPPGTYKFRFTFGYCETGDLNFTIFLHQKIADTTLLGKRYAGGLRIKQIEDNPGTGGQSVIKKYSYNYFADTATSSGILVRFPQYSYDVNVEKYDPSPFDGCNFPVTTYCSYVAARSSSNYPLASGQGGYVGYANVTEDLGNNGQVQHTYIAYPSESAPWPFPPVEDYDWERGSETNTKYFAKKNSQLALIKEVLNGYQTVAKGSVTSFKMGSGYTGQGTVPTIRVGSCSGMQNINRTQYDVPIKLFNLVQTTERIYDQNDSTKYTETVTDYTYDNNHYQLAQVRTQTSGSSTTTKEEIVTNKKYPQDYVFSSTPSGSDAQGIKELQTLHVVNVPIEEYTYRQQRNTSNNSLSNQRVINSIITTFKPNCPYPDQIFKLEIASPITLSSFGSGSGLSSNSFIKNSDGTIAGYFKSRLQLLAYDNAGNLISQKKSNDVPHTYLWSYAKNYPVAEVTNADSAYVAFTSFEADATGNWSGISSGSVQVGDAITGSKYYKQTSFSLSKSGLNSSNYYTVSYWSASGSYTLSGNQSGYPKTMNSLSIGDTTWTLYEHLITGQTTITISGTGAIDELRLFPKGSMMTTYTYAPLIGMTSQCDASGRITYYDYDSFGRLKAIRDQNQNVLKKYEYKYASQQ